MTDKDGGKSESSKKTESAYSAAPTATTNRNGAGVTRRSEDSVTDSLRLITHAFSKNVNENVIGNPHGALLPPPSLDDHARISVTSTHTMLMKRVSFMDIPVDFEEAIKETGHGCFQYKLMAMCGFVYACCSLSTTTLSIVLPAAQHDLELDSVSKGVLNTAPLWGMMVGAYFWGNVADNRGRRFVMLCSLSMDFCAAYVSSFCMSYNVFYAVRIFNGFGIIGATSILFAYTGEFLDRHRRDSYLARLELAWTFGIIALPVIGLAILPRKVAIGDKDGWFYYPSWRMFVFACGVPSMLAAVFVYTMPESPRFLLLQGKLDKTRKVLQRMFASNTGRPKEEFSVKVISESSEADTYYFQNAQNATRWTRFKTLVIGILKQHRDLFSGRSLFNILITSYVDFGLISVYYTMTLWVPELLNRVKHHHDLHPDATPTLCEVAGVTLEVDSSVESEIKTETFVHTIITCLACMPTTLLLLCLIEVVSKKILLVGIMISAAVPAFFLSRVSSVFETVTMFSLLKSLTNLAEAILFCAVVEIFPIHTRGTALSLTVTVGRLGSILGNVIFGYLIDRHCTLLFYGMSGNLLLSGIACILLPKMKRGH